MTKKLIEKIFEQCFKPEEEFKAIAESFDLSEAERKTIFEYTCILGDIYGITLNNVRYISNGALLINSFAIAHTDSWQVFKKLFEQFGDNWIFEEKKASAWQIEEKLFFQEIKEAIEKWEEGSDELKFLLSRKGVSLLKAQNGVLISVNTDYLNFINDLHCSLDDVETPTDPIPFTHCDSLGFAGLLMPLKMKSEKMEDLKDICNEVVALIKAANEKEITND